MILKMDIIIMQLYKNAQVLDINKNLHIYIFKINSFNIKIYIDLICYSVPGTDFRLSIMLGVYLFIFKIYSYFNFTVYNFWGNSKHCLDDSFSSCV